MEAADRAGVGRRARGGARPCAGTHGRSDAPERWRGYQLKRARLLQVAAPHPSVPSRASARAGAADRGAPHRRGRPALRTAPTSSSGAERHRIIDYKSGGVLDREYRTPTRGVRTPAAALCVPRARRERKLATSAHLFPLQGAPIEIDVEPDTCLALAADALSALHAYNDLVPAPQPASPAPEICRWCAAATVCSPFWDSCDTTWAPIVQAAAGVVSRAFVTPLGGVTMHIEAAAGSTGVETVVVKNVDPGVFADAEVVSEGDEVAATGLIADDRGTGYWVGPSGVFTATRGTAHD